MSYPSRYTRPRVPRASLCLQERDLAILGSAYTHRYLTSFHVHDLCFRGVSLGRAQERLRTLWEHGLLERCFTPVLLGSSLGTPAPTRQPIYTLTRRGAELLHERGHLAAEELSHAVRRKGKRRPTLEHHLVVTDMMVALRSALRAQSDIQVHVEHEHVLWRRLARVPKRPRSAIVPDGAVTLTGPRGQPLTFYLEVVRAGVKGGNKNLKAKYVRYAELHHRGFFRTVYGHARLRAVIFATTSRARAERFRSLTKGLVHSRQLFWFGAYAQGKTTGGLRSDFSSDRVLAHPWWTSDGQVVTLGMAIEI